MASIHALTTPPHPPKSSPKAFKWKKDYQSAFFQLICIHSRKKKIQPLLSIFKAPPPPQHHHHHQDRTHAPWGQDFHDTLEKTALIILFSK